MVQGRAHGPLEHRESGQDWTPARLAANRSPLASLELAEGLRPRHYTPRQADCDRLCEALAHLLMASWQSAVQRDKTARAA